MGNRGTTGNGIRKGIILKDGSQIQQYDPAKTRLRRDPQRVQLSEQENQMTRGLATAGVSSSGLVDQGMEVNATANFAALFAALMATAAPSENLLLDPQFDDWSNGPSAQFPAMYGGSDRNLLSRAELGAVVSPIVGLYCASVDWSPGIVPRLGQEVFLHSGNAAHFNGVYHVPLVFSLYAYSQLPGNLARLNISTVKGNNGTAYTPIFEIAQTWTRYTVNLDIAPFTADEIEVVLQHVGDGSGHIYTDAWKLERGSSATAWVPSTRDVREILLSVSSATTGWVDVIYPGGDNYGLMPPDGEVWQILGLSAFVGSAGNPMPGAIVEFRPVKDGAPISAVATADVASSWRASIGFNENINSVITQDNRLGIQVKQTGVTATDILISVRYLVY